MLSMFWFVNSTGRGRELQSLASEYWVKKYGAGSSELSDARAEDFNLAKRLGFVHLGRLGRVSARICALEAFSVAWRRRLV